MIDAGLVVLGGVGFSVVWAARMIHIHAEPHVWHDPTERWVLGLCFGAYLIAWIPLWLLPLDFQGLRPNTRCDQHAFSWLQLLWTLVYVLNMAAGYFANDFARCYVDAGGFTTKRKTALALKELRIFYGILVGIVLAILLAVAWELGFFSLATWSALYDYLYALTNM
jgi:hypothetical protein